MKDTPITVSICRYIWARKKYFNLQFYSKRKQKKTMFDCVIFMVDVTLNAGKKKIYQGSLKMILQFKRTNNHDGHRSKKTKDEDVSFLNTCFMLA